MTFESAYCGDLHELVASLDDAEHMSDLMVTNEGLVEVLDEREGFREVVEEHAAPATEVFV